MKRSLSHRILVGLLALVFVVQHAGAALIGTQTALDVEQRAAQEARVEAFLARQEVREQLMALGVQPADAQARVAALTDAELAHLEQNLADLPAGGGALEAVAVVFLVLLLLELLGAIDIFPKI